MRFGTFSYNQARPWVPERQAFEELLEQIQLTERLGFDEAWFAEHHHSDYGMLASPNLIIANLAPRTQRLRFGNLVNVLPLYDPMRLAEECGMLDILTGGRLNVGLGRGVPRDDLKHGLDRDTAQARFEEGIEILLRAWTGETFNYTGKAWNYVDITCRPQPLQRPHPPIYYGATSPDSPAMVARRGWNLALSRQPLANCARAIAYRTERANHPPRAAAAMRLWCVTFMSLIPTSKHGRKPRPKSLVSGNSRRIMSGAAIQFPRTIFQSSRNAFPIFPGGLTVKRLDEWGTSLIGSPETVIKKARADDRNGAAGLPGRHV